MARRPRTIVTPGRHPMGAVALGAAGSAIGAALALALEPVAVAGGALGTALLAAVAFAFLGRSTPGREHSGDGWDACPACARLAEGPHAFAHVLAQAGSAEVRVAVVGLVRFSCPQGLRPEVGCELLSRLAQVGAGRGLYRLPGDRLALLSPKPEPELRSALHALANRANRDLSGATVAAALDRGAGRLREAFQRADAAMRLAAHHGGGLAAGPGEAAPHEPLTQQRADTVRTLATGTSAIAVAYQPVVELATGRVLGYEALMRPRDGRLQSPTAAFALARRLGLSAALDRACREAVLSDAPGLDMRRGELLFVNVAAHAFVDPALDLAGLAGAVRDAGLAPQRVVLEVADEPGVEPQDLARKAAAARASGFKLALDDVGGPGSRVETLRLCRVEFFKIDEALTSAAAKDPQSLAVFRSLAALANQAGCTLVVEGVETDALLRFVREGAGHALDPLTVQAAQGYHLGRPGPRPRAQPAAPAGAAASDQAGVPHGEEPVGGSRAV